MAGTSTLLDFIRHRDTSLGQSTSAGSLLQGPHSSHSAAKERTGSSSSSSSSRKKKQTSYKHRAALDHASFYPNPALLDVFVVELVTDVSQPADLQLALQVEDHLCRVQRPDSQGFSARSMQLHRDFSFLVWFPTSSLCFTLRNGDNLVIASLHLPLSEYALDIDSSFIHIFVLILFPIGSVSFPVFHFYFLCV